MYNLVVQKSRTLTLGKNKEIKMYIKYISTSINILVTLLIYINISGGGKIDILTVLIFYHAFTRFVMITFVLFKIRAFCTN